MTTTDAGKLRYAARIMQLSAALFAIAGVVWLAAGQPAAVGIAFLAVAVGELVGARVVLSKT